MARKAYKSIIVHKDIMPHLEAARTQYKEDNKIFGQFGLASHYLKLVEFYELNKNKSV